jgi:hypothetical protein
MIFSFLKGKIDIVLEKFDFSPGETIKGKVLIDLKKSIKAKGLKIGFYGIKIIRERITTARGAPTTRTRKEFIHKFEIPLDGEKEYLKGEYPFEIKIPENIPTQPKMPKEGILSVLIKGAKVLSEAMGINFRIQWYLEATLEIPMGFDMKKKIFINIG